MTKGTHLALRDKELKVLSDNKELKTLVNKQVWNQILQYQSNLPMTTAPPNILTIDPEPETPS